MAVDPYAPCPCGSGKKLKFCCSDLAGEIDKVQRMLEGDQPRAALSHLETTLAKSPTRASLLDIKAAIELSLGDEQAARQTVARYLQVDPQNASAHAQAALAAATAAQADSSDSPEAAHDAVNHLQDALELVADSIPARVLQAIGAVGQALLAAGDLIAARAHLWLYQGVAGDEDTRAMELLLRLNQMGGLPLLLRDNQFLREAPAGHACEARHDHAQLLASRGQWRRAVAALDELCQQHPELPFLHHNAAVVAGWLGDPARFVAGLREFARRTMAEQNGAISDDVIEAEAIAQLLDPDQRNAPIEVVRTTYDIHDEEALIDRLTRDGRTAAHRLSESELHALEGPRPRSTWLLLDRPLPETGVDISTGDTPRVLGVLSCYGRQTDRAERLELVSDRDESHADTLATLAEVGADSLGDVAAEEALGQSSAGESVLSVRWRFPDDTPIADRRRVMADERRQLLLEDWPTRPLAALGGKSPQEASSESDLKATLSAALMVVEQTASGAVEPAVFAELRERLGLPPVEAIDPSTVDAEILPLARVSRVDLSATTDDDLFTLYKRTELAGANEAALLVAREAVKRPGLAEDLPPQELYARLASLEPEIEAALGWIESGRQTPGQSGADWDLAELEIRVVEGQFEEANRLVHHIRDNHLNEEGVAERLYRLLYSLGAVPPPDQMANLPDEPPAAPAAPDAGGGTLWTPGGDEPSGAGGQKIWTPS